jgi:hypothetical protein
MAYPSPPGTLLHHLPLVNNHLKVSLAKVVDGEEGTALPVPSNFHTKLADVVGTFTQWPKHLIGFNEVRTPILFRFFSFVIRINSNCGIKTINLLLLAGRCCTTTKKSKIRLWKTAHG